MIGIFGMTRADDLEDEVFEVVAFVAADSAVGNVLVEEVYHELPRFEDRLEHDVEFTPRGNVFRFRRYSLRVMRLRIFTPRESVRRSAVST